MKKLLLISLVLPFIISSCRKEGCINSDATNYDEEASKDDGSCEYEGEVMFWTNCDLCCQIEVRIDGEYEGNTALWYSTEPDAPNCMATGCVSATLPVGSYEWSGIETCEGFIANGSFNVSANECTKVSM